jgi:outer membrane protein W
MWLLAALMLIVASNAHAAGVVIGVNGGILKYTGDFGDGWKTGFGGGATVDYMVNEMWAVGANFALSQSKHDDDGEDAAVVYPGTGLTGTISDKFTLTDFGVNGKYMFPMKEAPIHPYVVAGVGMYSGKEKFETDGYSEEFKTDSKFGFRGGAGATWMANEQFGVGIEGNFHSVQTEGDATNFYGVTLGLSWTIPTAAK